MIINKEDINIFSIHDLKFKKGEVFESYHIKIKNDWVYVSEEFARFLLIDTSSLSRNYRYTNYGIIYGGMYKLIIYVRTIRHSDDNVIYKICGSSGSHGFGGLEHTMREELGVRVRRLVIKKIVEIYLSTPSLHRGEKIKQILEKIKNKKSTFKKIV